jgi:hypothetical protein
MSERSLSHRSDGRGSSLGLTNRANSFGIESSRLLSSINNSPRVAGNPPPGFFILGPYPSIIRCWLTETFSNDSLLYAVVCSGSYASSIGTSILQELGVSDQTFEENGIRKIKLPVYLTEAKVHQASSRSASPAPQVPTLIAKFILSSSPSNDKSIQVVLGSDVLRAYNADIMFSQEKLMIFDEERNQLVVPLVRPEREAVYKNLATTSADTRVTATSAEGSTIDEPHTAGVIGRPGRLLTQEAPSSPTMDSPNALVSAVPSEADDGRKVEGGSDSAGQPSFEAPQPRQNDDSKSTTGSEKSFHTPTPKSHSGVWGSSWRANSTANQADAASKTASGYSRATAPRSMKVLRPGKSMANTTRSTSTAAGTANGAENQPPKLSDVARRPSQASVGETKSAQLAPTKSNPIGQATAFGWLNSGQPKRSTTNGDERTG